MELTASFKTGLRCLVALVEEPGRHSARMLAEGVGASEKYVEQVLMPLRRAGIVQSRRGPDGGYMLARRAGSISLAEVFSVLQGSFDLCGCPDQACGECVRPELWRSLEACWDATLNTVTLEHLASGHHLVVLPGRPTLQVGALFRDGAGI